MYVCWENKIRGLDTLARFLGLVIQSVVSLTSSLVVKMLTVLVSTISNSQVFFAEKKCEYHIFQQKYKLICHF